MLQAVQDGQTKRAIQMLYLGAAVVFLATIVLGIANVFSPQPIDRGQLLAHFHSGTIGWITLSVIATALWTFQAGREVRSGERNVAWILAGLGPLVVAGYVAAFGLYFSDNGPAWMLPLFGIPSGLVIITAMLFIATQFKHQAVVTTPHLLLFGALVVASLGATMGILVGLSHNGWFSFPAAGDAIGAHAGPMDMYLAMAFAAIVELLWVGTAARYSKAGMTQMALGVAGGFVVSFGLFAGIEPAAPLGLLLFLAAFVVYMARIGARALGNVMDDPGRWWGAVSLPIYVIMFVVLVGAFFIPDKPVPHALYVAFAHITFVGMATNLVFAMQSKFAGPSTVWQRRGIWTMNIGLVLFLAGEFMADRPDGALIMAIGVVMVWWQVPGRMFRQISAA